MQKKMLQETYTLQNYNSFPNSRKSCYKI